MRGRSVRKFKEAVEIRSHLTKKIQSHRYFPAAVIISILLVASCTHVWQRVKVMGLVHEVALLQKKNVALVDNLQKVNTEITSLSMSTRIERYAQDSLGLNRVTPDRLYTLVPKTYKQNRADELATMFSSIWKVADFLPSLTEAQATEKQLYSPKFETDETKRDQP